MSKSKNKNEAWSKVFESLSIVSEVDNHGYFDVTADQMKDIGQFEPRNMAKIDFREHLPPVMRDNDLACLAIKNGIYRIGHFDPFIEIPETTSAIISPVKFPDNYVTLNPKDLENECRLLDAAKISGVLANAFGENVELTVRGRSYSPAFDFTLNNVNFPVSSVQIEVDGGYEGNSSINLVEAKIGLRGSLNVRQLLYPQAVWEQRFGKMKSVRTFAVFYVAPVIRIMPVVFQNGVCFIDKSGERAYQIEKNSHLDIMTVPVNKNAALPEKDAPFPQADKFTTIIALFSQLIESEDHSLQKSTLFDDFDVSLVSRQADYYSNALMWLGLVDIEKRTGTLTLTRYGVSLSEMTHAERITELAKVIFGDPVFNWVLHHDIKEADDELCRLFSEYWNVNSVVTINRRLSTIRAWIRYFKEQTKMR